MQWSWHTWGPADENRRVLVHLRTGRRDQTSLGTPEDQQTRPDESWHTWGPADETRRVLVHMRSSRRDQTSLGTPEDRQARPDESWYTWGPADETRRVLAHLRTGSRDQTSLGTFEDRQTRPGESWHTWGPADETWRVLVYGRTMRMCRMTRRTAGCVTLEIAVISKTTPLFDCSYDIKITSWRVLCMMCVKCRNTWNSCLASISKVLAPKIGRTIKSIFMLLIIRYCSSFPTNIRIFHILILQN